MLEILNIILPVFLILASGYAAVKLGYLKAEIATALNAVTIRLAVPVLLFRAIYHLDFSTALHWPYLFSFYSGAMLSFIVGVVLARKIFKRRPGESIAVGFSGTFSNLVLIGVPIVERAFGAQALPLVYGVIAFHAPSLYAVGMMSMEFARSDGRRFGQTVLIALKSMFANPLMIGIALGAIFNLLSIPLPMPVEDSIEMISKAAIPVALIGIGAALTRYQIKAEMSETIMVTVMSLILHPIIAFVMSYYVFELSMDYVRIVVLVAAMPPGMNIYIFALLYDRAVALSASTIVVATSASIITISGWLWFLGTL